MTDASYIDCSDIEGTDMYCAREAEEELERRISRYPLRGIHFLDSGNYHYLTGLFTRRIREPYRLFVFDNHSDMKPALIPELLSCGAWAKQVLEEDPNLRELLLIGPPREAIRELEEMGVGHREKLLCVSREELEALEELEEAEQSASPKGGTDAFLRSLRGRARVQTGLPVYLSVDKDVLSQEYARTNWDQGEMTLPLLKKILADICAKNPVLGADICGGLPDAPAGQEAEVRRINGQTDRELYRLLKECLFGEAH